MNYLMELANIICMELIYLNVNVNSEINSQIFLLFLIIINILLHLQNSSKIMAEVYAIFLF